jgi:NADH pyrophosphatase NudC (nudix superfamily)
MPEEAVLREVREEVGLEATLESYIGMYEFYRKNQLIIAYHLRASANNVVIDPDEIADYKFIPIDKVRPWTAGTGRALSDWLATQNLRPELVDFDTARN